MGLIDQKSINALQHLEKQQRIAVGKITSQYPLFLEIQPQNWSGYRWGNKKLAVTRLHSLSGAAKLLSPFIAFQKL